MVEDDKGIEVQKDEDEEVVVEEEEVKHPACSH